MEEVIFLKDILSTEEYSELLLGIFSEKNSILWKLLIIMNNETYIRHMKTTIEKLSVTNSESRKLQFKLLNIANLTLME